PGAIRFKTIAIPDAIVGQEYLQDIAVANQDGSALAKPLVWRVSGAVPTGLSVTPQAELITVAGRPTQPGTFTFAISVEDNNGRTDSLEFTMTVHPTRYRVLASMPEVLRPGETVSVPLSVSPNGTVTYRVVNGSLPPGLTLDAAGSITGTVADEGSDGMWSFVLEARDAAGTTGITPLAMRVERLPRAAGCSSSGSDWSPLALLAGLAMLIARRRPSRAGLMGLAAAAVALVPGIVRAQTYEVSVSPIAYQPLTNGTVVNSTTQIPVPINFPFFTGTFNSVYMSQYGYLALDAAPASSSANQAIPHSSTTASIPKSFIAPWWDALVGPLSTTNGYRYQISGAAPNRTMAFEWNAFGANAAANRISFQVILYETTGRVRFAYSTALPGTVSASVGIQKEAGVGVGGLTCSPNCNSTAYPAGQAIDFFRPPDFEITSLSAPQVGHSGVAFPQTAIVRNKGGRDSANVAVRFYLSTDAALNPMVDTPIGTATGINVPAQSSAQATLNAPLPTGLTAGTNYFIFAVVDPDNVIAEESNLNNTSAPQSITIGAPTADLVVNSVTAPTTAMPGATLQVARAFQNVGNADSVAAKYSWFFSDNASVSIADRALGVGNLGVLTPAQIDMNMEPVTLPADLAPGSYWIGACVNFDSGTSSFGGSEITIVNNCFTQSAAILVSAGSVAIATTPLPAATQFAPYGLRLQATGGTGQYTWEVAGGSLPPGMTLSAAGDLVGSPSTTGSFAFDAKVTSGALTDQRMLSLQVAAGGLPLVIVPQSLTAAEFSRAYLASLVAVGGKPPYKWNAVDPSKLPPGMGVATDGLLEGRPQLAGEFVFEVQVEDAESTKVTHELTLRVVTPTSLSIATAALERGLLGREYLQPLVAIGGAAPYKWSLIRFQELPENSTDAPGAVLYNDGMEIAFPAEMGLSIDDRDTADYLSGTPARAGLFSLTFKVRDGNDTEDTASVLLRVSYRDGLAITTLQLPDVFSGQPYQVRLSHNGGSDAEGIAFSLPCVQQAVRPGEFQCAQPQATESLPAGLMLQADGTILGTTNAEPGVYTFLAKVSDARGRQDVRAIALRVRGDFSTQRSGCSAVGLPPSTLLALALGALALRRRRR
ncbi:MAG: putative Ig domain-containing protein, partial [Archangium sp.]